MPIDYELLQFSSHQNLKNGMNRIDFHRCTLQGRHGFVKKELNKVHERFNIQPTFLNFDILAVVKAYSVLLYLYVAGWM